jgi:predicted chitinase
MSLLTEEQIANLACIASNQSTSRDLHDEFREWNEKQTGTQFVEPDWAEAPENTAIAKVALFWVTEDNLMLGRKDLASIEKPVNGADGD